MVRPQTIFGLSREGDKKDISIEASHPYGANASEAAFVILGAITFCTC